MDAPETELGQAFYSVFSIELDSSIGEPEWRHAASRFMEARKGLIAIAASVVGTEVGAAYAPAWKFLPTWCDLPVWRLSEADREMRLAFAHRSRHCRDAALKVLFAPAPSPREMANKLKLFAFIERLEEPGGWNKRKAAERGWTRLEEFFGQLFLDAHIVHQHHDAELFDAKGRRRKACKKCGR